MSISKGKERVTSPTGNTIVIATVSTVQAKNTYPKIEALNTFLGDRKKFKAYEAQCRMYL
jgi:hypothetical protein